MLCQTPGNWRTRFDFSQHDLAWSASAGTWVQTGGSDAGQEGCGEVPVGVSCGKERQGTAWGLIRGTASEHGAGFGLGPRSRKRTMPQGVFRGVQEIKV